KRNTRQQSLLSGIATEARCRPILGPATSLSSGTSCANSLVPDGGAKHIAGLAARVQWQNSAIDVGIF
ncbi:MAG: hypothetical protein WBM84_03125, partial [Sedimenticolaceae bacterium]